MARRSIAVLLALVSPAAAEPLTCSGPFAKGADEAALVKAFGRGNVERTKIDAGEGSTEPGTVVFGKDPHRRIEIHWHDPKNRRRPNAIIVGGGSGWTVGAEAGSPQPIAIGTPVEAVEAANGRSFALSGFGWDMGGYSADWGGGKLATLTGGCSLVLRFQPDEKAKEAVLSKVSGERRLKSSDPNVRKVKATVSQIQIGWGE